MEGPQGHSGRQGERVCSVSQNRDSVNDDKNEIIFETSRVDELARLKHNVLHLAIVLRETYHRKL